MLVPFTGMAHLCCAEEKWAFPLAQMAVFLKEGLKLVIRLLLGVKALFPDLRPC